ncbi:TPA: cell surface protein, partial [Bacillus wiedmannii]|nr:cell surface protein [Bacillus wiedmannii]
YFDPNNGKLRTGWVQDNGKMYYMDLSYGTMKTGWVWIEETGKMYYFDSKGVLQTGWVNIDGTMYYFDLSNGTLKTGWLEENGKTYYFDPNNGKLRTGWVQDNGKMYYMDLSYGTMKTGWNKIDGKMSYFKENGQWVENARELTVRATAYTNDPLENGARPGQHVYTKMGDDLTANPNLKVIAVDPSVIPLGSKVYVEGYGPAEARDTGGAIKGNKIDVFVPSKEVSRNWGVQTVKIYVLP